nr:MAG: E7 protein [Hydrurga leptonyx papillomavirus 2]
MIGKEPSLKDIVLEEVPCPVDLRCYEEVEEAERERVDPDQNVQPYNVLLTCGHCDHPVRIVVLATHKQIRDLQRLLLEGLALTCPICVRQRQYF